MKKISNYSLPQDSLSSRIKSYYLESTELTKRDEKVRLRWSAAFTYQLETKGSDGDCAEMLVKEFGISKHLGYKDVVNAKNLFGDVRKADKEALRYMVTQWSIELLKMAQTKKDFRGMEKALERITKANNLDKEDQDLPDPGKVHPPVQLLQLSFNFVKSEFFHLIDQKAQDEILKVVARVEAIIEKSTVKDYLDIYAAPDDHKQLIDGS